MHAGTWGVGNDDIRPSVFCNKLVCKDILHVTGKEQGVVDVVDLGVYLGIFDSLWHIFDADDLPGFSGDEVGDGAGAGIEVVN